MVVLQPIKPGSPPVRVGLSLKRGRARRALSLLGNNNTQQNMQLAESLLTISAEEFAHKYNFDPIEGVPLAHGRFQWRPFTPANPTPSPQPPVTLTSEQPHPADDVSKEQTTCITLPSASSSRHPQVSQSQAQVTPSLAQVTQSQAQVTQSLAQVSQSQAQVTQSLAQVTQSQAQVTQSHPQPQVTTPQTSCSSSDLLPSSDTGSRSRETQTGKDESGNHAVEVKGSPEVKEPTVVQAEVGSTVASDTLPDEGKKLSSTTSEEANQALRLRQTSITEYVRPRKLATFKSSELPSQSSSSSYSKKRPASSLQDQLSQPPHKKLLLHLRA